MAAISAGLLLYRIQPRHLEVLLVHPGGPFWSKKDRGAWSIPKGAVNAGEDLLAAAHREFREELGSAVSGLAISLGEIRQRSGKIVHAWALQGNFDTAQLRSNTVEMEWPRHSGKWHVFPEVDRAAWFDIAEAQRRMLPAQLPLLARLVAHLEGQQA